MHGGADGSSMDGGGLQRGGSLATAYSNASSGSSGSVHGPSTPPAGGSGDYGPSGSGGGGFPPTMEGYPRRPPPRMSSSFAGSTLASPNRPGFARPQPPSQQQQQQQQQPPMPSGD